MSRWLLVALLTVSGCAFSLDGPDPNRPRNQMPKCDTSKGAVVLDGVMATALGVVTMTVAADGGGAASLLPLSIGALYLGGALAGNSAVNECRKAQNEYTQSYGDERYARSDRDREADDDDDERPSLPEPPRVKYDDAPGGDVYGQRRPAPVRTEPTPPASTPPTAPVAAPAPTPAPKAANSKAPPKPAASQDDEWSDFWREVP